MRAAEKRSGLAWTVETIAEPWINQKGDSRLLPNSVLLWKCSDALIEMRFQTADYNSYQEIIGLANKHTVEKKTTCFCWILVFCFLDFAFVNLTICEISFYFLNVCIKANFPQQLEQVYCFVHVAVLCFPSGICSLSTSCSGQLAVLLGTEDEDRLWAVRTAGMCPRLSFTRYTGSWN